MSCGSYLQGCKFCASTRCSADILLPLHSDRLLHREMDANPCKYNIRINVRSVHKRFALSHAVERMLSKKVRPWYNFARCHNRHALTTLDFVQDDMRPSTSDLFSDPGILETLFQLWRPDRYGFIHIASTAEPRSSDTDYVLSCATAAFIWDLVALLEQIELHCLRWLKVVTIALFQNRSSRQQSPLSLLRTSRNK